MQKETISIFDIKQKIKILISLGWNHENINPVFQEYYGSQDIRKEIYKVLCLLIDHKCLDQHILIKSLVQVKPDLWVKTIEEILSSSNDDLSMKNEDNSDNSTKDKTYENIIEEIKKNFVQKSSENHLVDEEAISIIDSQYKALSKYRSEKYQKYQIGNPIAYNLNIKELSEIIDVAKTVFGHEPRPSQIISVLLLINKQSDKGRILEIKTGEGKTLIISIYAAYLVCNSYKVDIVTSSEILAIRDSLQDGKVGQFYQTLGISFGNNCQIKDQDNKPKECYLNKIVYGTCFTFQKDILSDMYQQNQTMNGRKPDFIIIDEVDSMLIDRQNHTTMIACRVPGMDYQKQLLNDIWMKFAEIIQSPKSQQIGLISNPEKKDEYIEINIDEYVEQEINELISLNMIQVPQTEMQYVKELLPVWIQSAKLVKTHYKQDQNYVIKDEEIKTVDYQNTGEIQQNMQFRNCVHQFLQIKHGLKFTSEIMMTNWFSNVSFFKQYGSKILGLTGTAGCISAQKFLSETYNIEFCFIPTFRKKIFIEHEPIVASDLNSQIQAIKQEVIKLRNRAILIICETINHCKQIHQSLIPIQRHIQLYTDNLDDLEELKIDYGQIIIATNLAGRGTDIQTSPQVETYGGMHVIVAFLPLNLRVEQQAFGRTSRQGKKGSGRLILDIQSENIKKGIILSLQEISQSASNNIEASLNEMLKGGKIKQQRDRIEQLQMEKAQKQVKNILQKDAVFKKYVDFLHNTPEFQNDPALKQDFENKWAKFLQQKKNLNPFELMNELDDFIKNVKQSLQNDSYQPATAQYHLQRSHQHILNDNIEGALEESQKANQINTNNIFTAFQRVEIKVMDTNYPQQQKIDDLESLQEQGREQQGRELGQNVLQQMYQNQNSQVHNSMNTEQGLIENQTSQTMNNIANANFSKEVPLMSQETNEKIGQIQALIQEAEELKQLIKSGCKSFTFKDSIKLQEKYKLSDDQIFNMKFEGARLILEGETNQNKSYWGTLLIGVLGVGQIVVGSLLIINCPGAVAEAIPLIIQGGKDIFAAVQSYAKGVPLSVTKHIFENAMNYILNFYQVGFSNLKKGLKGGQSLTKMAYNKIFNGVLTPEQQLLASQIKTIAKDNLSKLPKLMMNTFMAGGGVQAFELLNKSYNSRKNNSSYNDIQTIFESIKQNSIINFQKEIISEDLFLYIVYIYMNFDKDNNNKIQAQLDNHSQIQYQNNISKRKAILMLNANQCISLTNLKQKDLQLIDMFEKNTLEFVLDFASAFDSSFKLNIKNHLIQFIHNEIIKEINEQLNTSAQQFESKFEARENEFQNRRNNLDHNEKEIKRYYEKCPKDQEQYQNDFLKHKWNNALSPEKNFQILQKELKNLRNQVLNIQELAKKYVQEEKDFNDDLQKFQTQKDTEFKSLQSLETEYKYVWLPKLGEFISLLLESLETSKAIQVYIVKKDNFNVKALIKRFIQDSKILKMSDEQMEFTTSRVYRSFEELKRNFDNHSDKVLQMFKDSFLKFVTLSLNDILETVMQEEEIQNGKEACQIFSNIQSILRAQKLDNQLGANKVPGNP